MPTQISLQHVSKAFGERRLLEDVTFAFPPEHRTGLIGENGAGKSTVLRMLAGRDTPDNGQVVVQADGGAGYLGQDASLPGHLRVRQLIDQALARLRAIEARLRELEPLLATGEQRHLTEYGELATVFELRGGYDADARVRQALHGLKMSGVDQERRLRELSGGEQSRLFLAAVLAANPELLLLDEPTNHLDDDAMSWLEEHLRGRRGTTVVVSHDRVFLERVATTLVEVDPDRRTLTRYGGGYPGYLTERAAARQRWRQEHERWQAEVRRLREAAATTARAVAPGRAMRDRNKIGYDQHGARVQQSLASRVRSAEQKLRRLLDAPVPPPPEPLRFTPPPWSARATGRVLSAQAVAVAGRLSATSVDLDAGQRLLITGRNGAGKSTLLRVLAGDLEPDTGTVARRGRVGYLPQDLPEPPEPGQSVLAAFARGWPGPPERYLGDLLSLGLLPHDSLWLPVEKLSTGQWRRLALARLFTRPADLLLLDEPTNHLSLELVEQIERALDAYPGAVVVVSHDRRLRARWRGESLAMDHGTLGG